MKKIEAQREFPSIYRIIVWYAISNIVGRKNTEDHCGFRADSHWTFYILKIYFKYLYFIYFTLLYIYTLNILPFFTLIYFPKILPLFLRFVSMCFVSICVLFCLHVSPCVSMCFEYFFVPVIDQPEKKLSSSDVRHISSPSLGIINR